MAGLKKIHLKFNVPKNQLHIMAFLNFGHYGCKRT